MAVLFARRSKASTAAPKPSDGGVALTVGAAAVTSLSWPARPWLRSAASTLNAASVGRGAALALAGICGVAASAFARGATPDPVAAAVAAATLIGFGVQAHAARSAPSRLQPRDRRAVVGAALLQIGLVFWMHPPLLGLLAIVWLAIVAASVTIEARPSLRLVAWAVLAPLAGLFAAACDGLVAHSGADPQRAAWPALFLLATANGACLELALSTRGARDRSDVYARAWGVEGASRMCALAAATALSAACAAAALTESGWTAVALLLVAVFPSFVALTAYAQWPTVWRARRLQGALTFWALASLTIVCLGPLLEQALR